jgi:phosphoserine phosphatase
MTFALTIVASSYSPLAFNYLSEIAAKLECHEQATWLAPDHAATMILHERPTRQDVEWLWTLCARDRYDVLITPEPVRRKKLLLADMDATIVTGETLDDLAGHAGVRDKIAAITARAMRGDLDFKSALRERVGLLKGLGADALEHTMKETTLSDGAAIFVRTMSASGALCVLVSGGFTQFTGSIADKTGFHLHHGNLLRMEDDRLTGTVSEPILDKNAKLDFLNHYRKKLDIPVEDVMAIGDGANDLPMLQAAGLGIGYRPKPVVQDSIDNCILWGDLTAALYAQGFKQEDFAAAV